MNKGQNVKLSYQSPILRKNPLPIRKQKLELDQKNLHSYLVRKTKATILEFNFLKIAPDDRDYQEDEYAALGPEPEVTDCTLKKLAQVIQLSTKIHTLKIDCPDCHEVTDQGLKYLCESIRGLTSLKSLNLNFKRSRQKSETLTNGGLYHLHDALKTLTSLKDLKLSFQNGDENTIGDSGVVMLGLALQKLPSLRNISLEFVCFHEITNTGISCLSQSIRRHTLLKTLSLRFEGTGSHKKKMEIDSTGLQTLSQNLEKLTSLQRIDLSFEECREITQEGVNAIYQSVAKLVSMQNLRLNFRRCFESTNEGIENFGLILKPLSSSLKSLYHDFYGFSNITEVGIQNLGETLGSFSLLESLSLDFEFYSTTPDAGTQQFFQALSQLTLLKHISLHFHSCVSISNEGFSMLCHSLTKLTALQSINLNFENCVEIGDLAMRSLGETLRNSSSLRNLHLDFSYCSGITEVGVFEVCQVVSQLTLLQDLHLDFAQCPQIRKGIYALGQALKNLTSLQSFYLRCEEVGDLEFSSFTEGIKGLVSLQNMNIIVHSNEVSQECFDSFVQALKSLQYLRYIFVRLTMLCCENEDPQQYARRKFYPALKTFPNIKNLDIDFRGDSPIEENVLLSANQYGGGYGGGFGGGIFGRGFRGGFI